MTSLLTKDCSRFLPPQHRTLDHRLFEDVSVAQQDPRKIGDMAQAVTQIRRGLGARPLRHRNASTISLKDIRCGARSQCSRWSRGMIWSYQLALNTSCAAAFITDCNWRSCYNGRPANVPLPKSSFDNTMQSNYDGLEDGASQRTTDTSPSSQYEKQFDTLRTTWEHMLTSESK